jgi:diguanylate cyclase (GGDEF)-like protein
MIKLADVTILAKIHENTNSIVYRGRRDTDSQPVILKLLKEDYPIPIHLVRYQQEFELTRHLNLPGIVQVYELKKYQNSLAIIFEDLEAESLKQWLTYRHFELLEFLNIAIKIAEILDSVHQKKIIHKDINPSNIIYNAQTKEIRLIDFGIATNLLQENLTLCNLKTIEGTFAYMSPEQTGRMNRAIDYRTDLYSLGVTFYELLTNKLPFDSSDPLELVHCHIAKQPKTPHEINSQIPLIVSDIVMKLMAKTAEDRYQSAHGVKVDLEFCRDRLQQSGKIANFLLGCQDFSDKFQIPQKLYGREQQIKTLLSAFESVSQGQTEIILVSGYSGIGKTALVREIYKPITKERGYFISGKFELLQRDIPYSGIVKALQELIGQLLAETEEELQVWRKKILAALGNNGRVIIDAIPEIEAIIGEQPTVPQLNPNEAQNRFNLVFLNFFRIFCQPKHPLVIFLDDLQWADSATLQFLQVIASEPEIKYFFLIGTYRNNEVEPSHPLNLTIAQLKQQAIAIAEIALHPLELSTVIQIITDTLKCTSQKAYLLARLVFEKTQGNPFFINEFLKSLYLKKLLKFDFKTRQWQWDIEEIKTQKITANVVDLMVENIQKLPQSTQEILQLGACIGEQFSLKILSILKETSLKLTAKQLWLAVEMGLIFPVGENYKFIETELNLDLDVVYKFAHDRILQAAYFLIPENRKQEIHLHIGRLLLKSLSVQQQQEKLFDLVNHLNYGIDLLKETQERIELAQLNLKAARKARASAAYQPARNYFQYAIALLPANAWEQQYSLALTLYTEAAEVAYLCGNFKEMEHLAETIKKQAKTNIETIKVDEIVIYSCIARNQMLEALNIALKVLKRLEIELPEEPNPEDMAIALAQTQASIGDRKPAELAKLALMSDPRTLGAIQILSSVAAAAYFALPSLYPLLVFKMVDLLATYGNTPLSSFIYASYGLLLCGASGNIELGYEFGQLALTLSRQQEHKSYQAKTLFLVNHFIIHWKEHAKATLQPLQVAYLSALESGDLQYTGFSAFVYSLNSYFLGKGLVELEQTIANYSHTLKNLKQQTVFNYNQIYRQGILNLITTTDDPGSLRGEAYDETVMLPIHQKASDRTAIVHLFIHKLILCYLFEDFDRAVQNADIAKQYLDGTQGTLTVPVFYFYDSLAHLAIYQQASEEEKESIRDRIGQNQTQMKQWAKFAPMNFTHKFYLVKAEWLRILGETSEAMDYYDRAIELTRQHEYLNDEAIACELAAKFYVEKGRSKIARTYFQDAHYSYLRWGATAKVKDLETRYPKLLERISTPIPTTAASQSTPTMPSSSALDLLTVMKAFQTLSEEIVLEKLLKKFMLTTIENAGAQRGFLILEHQGQLLVEAEGAVDADEVDLWRSLPITAKKLKNRVPTSIIHYAARTRESVVLNNASQEGKFTRDPYIRRQQQTPIQSVLCAPLLHQGKLLGVVYLENNLVTGAFTSERLEMVKLLCSQGAISLENARLYAEKEIYAQTLEQKVAERTAELEQVNRELLRLATLDGLTQVANRRLFDEYLAQEWKRAFREQQPLSLILFDVDYFKLYNDHYGHQAGDDCLKQIAQAMSNAVKRSIDLAARYGGEEFAAILSNTDAEGATIVAQEIREQIVQLKIPHARSQVSDYVTLSLGIASIVPSTDTSSKNLIAAADEALYEAKRQGRDRLVVKVLKS